jgi:hypothetical protein
MLVKNIWQLFSDPQGFRNLEGLSKKNGRQAPGYNTIPFQGIKILIAEDAKRVFSFQEKGVACLNAEDRQQGDEFKRMQQPCPERGGQHKLHNIPR